MKLLPIINEILGEGLNLQKQDKNFNAEEIRNCSERWNNAEIEYITKIAESINGKFFGTIGTGGGCEVMMLQVPNGKVINFSNITNDICISEKSYNNYDQYEADFNSEDDDEFGGFCSETIVDYDSMPIDEIIQTILELI